MQRFRGHLLVLVAIGCSTSAEDGLNDATLSEAALSAGTYEFQTLTGSGKCIDVNAGNPADGTNIQQWTCFRNGPQSFRVESLGNGLSRIVNTATNKCVDVAGAGKDDGTNIHLWTCNGTGAQIFKIEDAGSGRVVIRNPNSDKCIDVSRSGTHDGANIQLWRCNGTNAQFFRPVLLGKPKRDVTFFVVSDTHADPPESMDLRSMAAAVNRVAASGSWPSSIAGSATGFDSGTIGVPMGVVLLGDLMGWGVTPLELRTFRRYFEKGHPAGESIAFSGYIGLGNHDVDNADRVDPLASEYRNQAWAFVDERHKGSNAPVPVSSFDAGSHAYSWDFGGVHFIQAHRAPGDTGYGLPSNLPFIKDDLRQRASDGRPVFMFHHYGLDRFGTEDRWWTASQRNAYRDALNGYNVVGIFAGHSHAAFNYTWEGRRVFQVNNAKAETTTGNKDGNGSFAIVRITEQKLNVVTCRWLDERGNYEFVAPYYSGNVSW